MKVVFIGGTGSSGTRVIRDMLLKHHNTYGIDEEIRFICDPDGLLDLIDSFTNKWSPYDGEIALRRFKYIIYSCFGENFLDKQRNLLYKIGINPHKYSYLNLSKKLETRNCVFTKLIDSYINKLRFSISDSYWFGSPKFKKKLFYETFYLNNNIIITESIKLISQILNYYPGHSENKFWVDNTPFNLIQSHRLIQLFPEMKLIHVYREPKDVISSFKHRNYGSDEDIINAKRLVNIWRRWIDVRKVLPINSYYEINLKDVVSNQKIVSKNLCRFLGWKFDNNMLSVSVNKSNYGRWKLDIDQKNLMRVNSILSPIYSEINKLNTKLHNNF